MLDALIPALMQPQYGQQQHEAVTLHQRATEAEKGVVSEWVGGWISACVAGCGQVCVLSSCTMILRE